MPIIRVWDFKELGRVIDVEFINNGRILELLLRNDSINCLKFEFHDDKGKFLRIIDTKG